MAKKTARSRKSAALPGDAPTVASELVGRGDHAGPPAAVVVPREDHVVDLTARRPDALDRLRHPKMQIEDVRVDGATWRALTRLRSKHPGKSLGDVAGIELDKALADHLVVEDNVPDAG